MCVCCDIIDRWIVTAGHCLRTWESYSTACFGVDSMGECRMRINITKSNQYRYPLYDDEAILHDIGKFSKCFFENQIRPRLLHKVRVWLKLYFFHSPSALFELPTPIAFNQYIRPARLTNACDAPYNGGEEVIAAGMGVTEKQQYFNAPRSEVRLRQVNLMTLSSVYCAEKKIEKQYGNATRISEIKKHRYGIICVKPNYERAQCTAPGDSGKIVRYKLLDHIRENCC